MTWDQLQDQCSQRCSQKAVSEARLAAMGAAGEKRHLKGSVLQDAPVSSRGIRGPAPGKVGVGSDIAAHLSGKTQADGKRERASARGVKVSDILAQSLG